MIHESPYDETDRQTEVTVRQAEHKIEGLLPNGHLEVGEALNRSMMAIHVKAPNLEPEPCTSCRCYNHRYMT